MPRLRRGFPASILWILVALTLGWGFNWPMIKLALSEIPVLSFRSVCLLGGASSLSVLMIPVVGVFSGMLVLGEVPHWQDYAALALVLAALATVMLPPGSLRGCFKQN